MAFAAGGGGDAISAAVLGHALADQIAVSAIMSWSWDRLLMDPLPGPRSAADFDGLIDHGSGLYEVGPNASLNTGGLSTLPRLANHTNVPMLLADPEHGAVGLSRQLRRAAKVFNADLLLVVDVGGDILAAGHEPGLRSPLADSLALAAAVGTGLPTDVLVTGLGLDGELALDELEHRLARLEAARLIDLQPQDAAELDGVWQWHPSEANALLAVAAAGWRGRVESQRDTTIVVDGRCTTVFRVEAGRLANDSIAADLASVGTLDHAEQLVRARRGISDIDIERKRLVVRRQPRTSGLDALDFLDRYVQDAANRGTDALTIRRVLELTDATSPTAATTIREHLRRRRPENFLPPLYLTSPCPGPATVEGQ
ncbi:DUF1152 domain-containing protein [Nocardia puris]|uniref:DUF1152 domain-containing protein n=1 Tax=Nocardia puris TaxID=208602 RepID=UPI0008362D70|nr:DUF1152 domain-containing protein [Nocardia puris]MBF6370366.1 DUF1152 domain-containing protein [Nocardia puris]